MKIPAFLAIHTLLYVLAHATGCGRSDNGSFGAGLGTNGNLEDALGRSHAKVIFEPISAAKHIY